MHTGRTPCEDEDIGLGWDDASPSQGLPTIAPELPEAR